MRIQKIIAYLSIIITKPQSKPAICNKKQVSMQKIDTIVANDNGTIKLILWEQLIDSVHTGLQHFNFNNLTIRIFDDEKFVNSNELTAVEPIDDITIHMETPEIKDKLLVGQCIAVALISQHHALRAIKFNQLIKKKNFTCCNNAIQSFFTPKLCPTPHLRIEEDEMKI